MTNYPGNLSANFQDQFYALAPPWLRTGNAEKYLYTLQLCSDLLLDKMSQAATIGMPGQGDPSQLPYLATDRVLVQGPSESNSAFAGRLKTAFPTWKKAGSRLAILGQMQAYMQNMQPGVAAVLPEMVIVGGNTSISTWSTTYEGDAIGAPPTLATVPANWDWDGKYKPWRSWLILFMYQVATPGLSGSAAATSTATGVNCGTGHNISGVWVPNPGGGVINTPFLTITGLSGLTNVSGRWLTLTGSAHSGNNGTFPILSYPSSSSAIIANPKGVTSDAGPLTWSVGTYPFIAPGPTWGASGLTFGQGELQTPPVDAGSNLRGIWQPTSAVGDTYGTSFSWGLSCSPFVIQTIRLLLKRWKSAGAYYPDIIVSFDGDWPSIGEAPYSPNSTAGGGNPDGTFGGRGENVNGVWSPNRKIASPFTCFCQGTGNWDGSPVEVS